MVQYKQIESELQKTKEMRINFRKPMDLTPITINGEPIEQVKASKMLGVILAEDLGWEEHINQITSKASQRLHFLTILKRAGLRQADLNTYYCAVIRPVLEYAVPVWHPGLTKAHTSSIERIQKRALKVIYPHANSTDRLQAANLESLEDRRKSICRKFFIDMQNQGHKLHKLLPKQTSHNS